VSIHPDTGADENGTDDSFSNEVVSVPVMSVTGQSDADEGTLARARAGDAEAFRVLTDPYRRELQLHCYRILGSIQDAEDLLQETLLAAWRSIEKFEGRSSVRTWLYRIATNRCLNALRARSRRPSEVRTMPDPPTPTRRSEPIWLEPYPDALLEQISDGSPGPAASAEARESIELAFIAALQRMPPSQRAALVLRDVLGFHTAEIAAMLDASEASVKGALQRARAAGRARPPGGDRERARRPSSERERELADRFADAVSSGDIDAVVALLTDAALLTMPPQPLEYEGHEAIAAFLRHRAELRGAALRVVPTRANTQPAFACYLPDPHAAVARPWGMIVLTLEEDAISAITWFADTGVFRPFGLPRALPEP
jgi:RNA polymerase sigma-70 factor (ECF subfamily)